MSFLDCFFAKKIDVSANLAKERLKIIIAHERSNNDRSDFLPKMRQEIIDIILKYLNIDQNKIEIQLKSNVNCKVLALSVIFSDRNFK